MSSLLEQASLIITPNGVKAGKLYGLKGTDLDVVRATTATRVNSAGLIETVANNVARLDYTDGSCPSILVEPQRTNLLTYSEQFDDISWGKFFTNVSANSSISPSGLNNADKLIEDSTDNFHGVNYMSPITPTGTNTLSVYAKQGERNWIVLYIFDGILGSLFAWFDVANGTIGSVNSGLIANIENTGNGWYRCAITRTQNNIGNGGFILSSGNGSLQYQGNGTSGAFIWGAQLEAGSYPTSYIPTVATASTRNADVISKTGIADLIGQTEGTLFFEGKMKDIPLNVTIFGVEKAATNSVIRFHFDSAGQFKAQCFNGTSNLFLEIGLTIQLNTKYKFAFAYKKSDYAFYINGNLIATGSDSTDIPSCDKLETNSLWGNLGVSCYQIKTAALFKTRLTNAELAELTTL